MDTTRWYQYFAEVEAKRSSATYERLAIGVSQDPELIQRIDQLPASKRQPNLLFASVQFLRGPTSDWDAFRWFVINEWDSIADLMRRRSTQTNEAARCSALLPVLGRLRNPVALIEVGASAGLCLFPDRYSYSYNDIVIGDSALRIEVECTGPVPVPAVLPDICWRAGVDLNPLDVTDPADLDWLRACIWPEHHQRRNRLDRAVTVAAADPPPILRGDLNAEIDRLLESTPKEATTVVWHSAVLSYLTADQRNVFAQTMNSHPEVVWVSNEAPGVVDGLVTSLPPPASNAFVLGLNGTEVLAYTDPHGNWLAWADEP